MTDSFVTQCPHCQTSFRITRAQLGAAHGAVRCGACMQVFNAAQQMLVDQNRAQKPTPAVTPVVPEPARIETASPRPAYPAHPVGQPATPASGEPAPKTPSTKQSVDTVWIHDDLDLDNLDLDEELAKLEEQEMQLSKDFLALKATSPAAIAHLRASDDDEPAHDEAWAETLLREENRKDQQTEQVEAIHYEPPIAALRDDDEEEDERESERTEPTFGNHETTEQDDEPAPIQVSRRNEPELRNDNLLDFDREPLQLDWQEERKPWGRWLGWSVLNLIAILALGGQYVAYHFEELARQDDYRPWFQQICPEIGCKLPSKVDIEQIKSSNLVVRSHPEFRNSLVVDAIIYNRATFAQPFPLLELRFADISGQLLASRRFKPSEYLGGELAGQSEMPPQTPIHVSLEILDPGAKAVNYSLSFHSPE